jgi:class 3 adenylate cyclase
MSSPSINEQELDTKLGALEERKAWSPRVISRLETTIRTGNDFSLFRINPIAYAKEKGMTENEAIDLFLYATKVGLFEMDWHMICAYCAHVVNSLRSMDSLHSHFVCDMCDAENNISMDDYIQVTFTISPHVRQIAFHDPASLSIEDFLLKYHFAKGIAPLADGSKFEDLAAYITKMATYIHPQESQSLEIDLPPGRLHALDIAHQTGVWVAVGDEPHPQVQNIPLQVADGRMQAPNLTLVSQEIASGPTTLKIAQLGEAASGKTLIEVANLSEKRIPVWVTHYPPGFQAFEIPFEPFLTGNRLLTTQTFRDLFRSETVQSNEGIGVKDITLLFTDLKGSTAMYDAIGDAKAYYLVRQHFDTLGRAIADNNGAVVKTIGDAVMAAFTNPADAARAAVDMLRGIEAFNRGISEEIILKVGIHRGRSIMVTLNDRLDYFGQTVNIAARVQGLADANEIYISQDAFDYPGVTEAFAVCVVSPEQVVVKGVSERLHVHKVSIP